MARTLKDKLAALEPARRAGVEAEANRLHTEYLTLQELRKAKELPQVQLAQTLGIQQATVAKYERQSDLLLSTLDMRDYFDGRMFSGGPVTRDGAIMVPDAPGLGLTLLHEAMGAPVCALC